MNRAAASWQDYWFLTKELHKFLQRAEWDMVIMLLKQREELQLLIAQLDSTAFVASAEGISLLQRIQQIEQVMRLRLQGMMQQEQTQQAVYNAYDKLGQSQVGVWMDRQS